MKRILTTLLVGVTLLANAQSKDDFRDFIKPNWKAGKEKTLYGHTLLKVEGHNGYEGFTNASYESLADRIKETEQRASSEMWTQERKEEMIKGVNENEKGGRLTIYIGRISVESGNTRHFTAVFQDMEGKEFYRKTLESDVPEVPSILSGRMWTNFGYFYIPVEAKPPFKVFIIDALGSESAKKTVFEVKN